MTEKTAPAFEGFIQPKKNYFHMPNMWIDICAGITNLAELKVVQYVLRHTWGFHEYGIPKAISVDEFMNGRRLANGTRMDKGTGLSNHSVIDGLKAAIKHGYLICEIDTSDLARVRKSYALKMFAPGEDSSPPEIYSPGEESTASYEESSPSYEEPAYPGEDSSHRSEKDTIRNTPKKDTKEKQGYAARAKSENAATSSASADTHTQSSSQEYRPDLSYASQNENDSHSHIANDTQETTNGHQHNSSHRADARSAEHDMQRSDAVPVAQSITSPSAGRHHPVESLGQDRGQATRTAVASQSAGAGGYEKAEQATLLAVSEDTKPVAEKKPKPLVMPPADAAWKTTTCLQMFNFWREGPLLAKHQQIKASQCAKALAENYTREQVEQVRAFMVERDEWWSLRPEAVDVCTVAENMHKKLAEMARANAFALAKPSSQKNQGKGYTLAVNDPAYDINNDFYNNAEAWAAFDAPVAPTGGIVHV